MTLPRSENLVSTMLSDTILALCRNTLQYKSEVCVEGLIGVTVDQKEVFLVHLNETILRDGGLSKSKRSDKLRKRQSEDVTDSSSESSDSKDSDSEHARSKRKRRRKRRRSKLKEVSEELAEQPKSLPTNENSQEAKDPANSDNLDKTTDSINSTRLSQPEKDSNSRNLKREKKDSDEDLVFVKEEPKEYTDNSSCSFGQSPFTLPGNPSGDSSQMYGGPPVGELGQLQEINMQMTNEQAMAINMSGQASTSSSSGGTPADQGWKSADSITGDIKNAKQIVAWIRSEMKNEGLTQKLFAQAVLSTPQYVFSEFLRNPQEKRHEKSVWIVGQFMKLAHSERQQFYLAHSQAAEASREARKKARQEAKQNPSANSMEQQLDRSERKGRAEKVKRYGNTTDPGYLENSRTSSLDRDEAVTSWPIKGTESSMKSRNIFEVNSASASTRVENEEEWKYVMSAGQLAVLSETTLQDEQLQPQAHPGQSPQPLVIKPRTYKKGKHFKQGNRKFMPKRREICRLLTPAAIRQLDEAFEENIYVSKEQRWALANKLGLSELTVQRFFQNRRLKARLQRKRSKIKVKWINTVTATAKAKMEAIFYDTPYISREERRRLAEKLHLDEKAVQSFFQHMRFKEGIRLQKTKVTSSNMLSEQF